MNCRSWTSSSYKGNLGVTCLRIIPTLCLLLLLGASDTAAQTYSTWAHNKVILFNTSASGANIAGNVSNFPVLVRLNSGNFDFSQALAGGADIRFEDPDGTVLAYQIEVWDGAAQAADIWIRVPQVDGSSITDYIRMFWGKAGATSESSGSAVFQTTNGFAGAWHLNEDGNTAAGGYPDATANGNSGTGTALTAVSDVSAISGNGQNFASASNQMINVGSGSTLNGSTALTIEAWIKITTQNGNAVIMSKAYTTNSTPFDEYKLDFNALGDKVRFGVTTGGVATAIPGTSILANGNWYYVAGTYDGSNVRLYLNGVEEGSAAKTGAIDNYSQALTIGKYYWDTTKNFDGVIDEPKVATVVRSPDWIKLTYANQKPSQNLVVIAPRVWDGGGADDLWSNPLNWNGDVIPSSAEDVIFDGTSVDNVTLGGNVSVRSVVMTTGYTGTFNFSSYTLTVNTGVADFRSGGNITAGTGTLEFRGATAQNFHPKSGATFPTITQDGSGPTTIVTNSLIAVSLNIYYGTFHLGSSLAHTVNSAASNTGGILDFGTSNLNVTGNMNMSSGVVVATSANTLAFTGATAQTYTHNTGEPDLNLIQNGPGGTTVTSNSITASTLTVTAGTFNTTTNARDITTGTLTINGGTLTADGASIDVNGDFSMTSGTFTLPASAKTFNVLGNYTQTGGTVTAGTGTVTFDAVTTGKTINAVGTYNALTFNGSGGGWTITTNGFTTTTLNLTSGTLNLGTSLIHSVSGSPSFTAGGTLEFGSSTLRVEGANVDLNPLSILTANTGTLEFNGASAQTFTPRSGTSHPSILKSGSGTVTLATYAISTAGLSISAGGFDLSTLGATINGNLDISGGTFTATNASLSVAGNFTLSGGSILMPTGIMYVGGSVSRTAGTATHNNGWLTLNGAATGKTFDFTPTLYCLNVAGSGGEWTAVNNGFNVSNMFQVQNGTFILGSVTHTTATLNSTGSGTLDFGSSTVNVTGNTVYLDGLTTLTPGSGTLVFQDVSGIQTLTGKAGSNAPHISHTGAGTLQLATNSLSCLSFTQAAGILDLNALNITTVSSGNFTLTNGTTTSLTGLAARTITVAGNATLSGTDKTNRLNLNPAGAWYLNVTGTASVQLANVNNANSTGYSTVACTNCANEGTSANWTYAVTWDGGGGNTNWSNSGNWASGYVPTQQDDVTFNATALNATLDAAASVRSLTFTTGYTGTFNFSSNTLIIAFGNADLRSGGNVLGGTGTLEFTSAAAQTFIPKNAAMHPTIKQNGAGGTSVTTNHLSANGLVIVSGTFYVGDRSVNVVSADFTGGGLDFGTGWLSVSGATVDFSALGTLTAGTGELEFTGSSPQTFTPKNGTTFPTVKQNGTGGTTVSTYGLTMNSLTLSAGTLNLGTGLTHSAAGLNVFGGGLDFGSSTLQFSGSSASFTSLTSMVAGTGVLAFTGSSTQSFTPNASLTFPAITQNGTGGTTVYTNNLTADALSIVSGTFNLGASLSHVVSAISTTAGELHFNSSTLSVNTGNVSLNGLTTLTPSTGTLTFTAPSGVQIFTPKSASSHPAIIHLGAGELELATYDLSCLSFNQSAGTLDFGGRNITTTAGGNFTLTNGTASTLVGLAGRTLTVAGNASLTGAASTSRLNLNPGAAWTLAVTGTLMASLASLDFSNASVSAGYCSNCANQGSNSNWTFAVTWDGGGADFNWTTALNWGSDAVPTSLDDVTFNATSTNNSNLDAAATVKSITFTSGYTGTFSFLANTLSVTGNADFQSGGPILAGTGTLAFTGTSAQTFIPKTSTAFPSIVQNGSGGTTLSTNALTAGSLVVTSGTLNLGTSFTHAVGALSGSGGLHFGTSSVNATGNVDLSGLTVTASSSNTLAFTGSSAQTYAPNASVTALNLSQNGTGGTTVATNNVSTPSLRIASGTFNLGASRTVYVSSTLDFTGGGLDFGSSYLQTEAATVDLSGLSILTANSGYLVFLGSTAQVLIPKAATTHPGITQNGPGGTTLSTNDLTAGELAVVAGTFNLGVSRTHSVTAISGSGGELHFNTSNLQVTSGNANLGGLTTVTRGSGTLAFTASNGTQVFTPKAGQDHPSISHTGAASLQLATNNLSCASFANSAGSLDLNGQDIATISSGNFTVANGTASTFTALAGRTLTVAGDASLSGTTSTSRLNLNPVSAWTLAVTGSLSGNLVSLNYNNASISAGTCSNCANDGNNTNWIFDVTWDGEGGDANWSTAGNWGSDAVPTSLDNVTFNATAIDATLDAAATVKSITFTSGYTGAFSFSANTLSVTGDADFRSGGLINANTGALAFTGTGAQTFIPKSGAVFPAITQNGNAGTTTLSTNALAAGNLTLTSGTLNLGSSMTHAVGAISGSAGLDFGTSNLNATGNVDLSGATVTAASSNTLSFTGASAQTFTPNASVTALNLTQNGTGGTTVSANNFTTGALTLASGTLNLGAGLTHSIATLSAAGGGLHFGSSILKVSAATVDLDPLAALTPGSGTLELNGASQTLTPKASTTHPSLTLNNSTGATLVIRGWTGGALTITSGSVNLGTGLSHSFTDIVSPSSGSLQFGSSAVDVSGNANFNGLTLVDGGTGSLTFSASSGTQIFTPETGSPFPALYHTGAGILQLATNDLDCASFNQSAGTLDLNGRNITTATFGGFTVTNGTAASFTGLAGRTLTVGGNASFTGQAGNLVNLNPASTWTLAVSGTLAATLAQVAFCNAFGSTGDAMSSVDGGGNTNWSFSVTWDGGGTDENWNTSGNWSSDAVPIASTRVLFDASSTKDCNLDVAATVKSIVFGTGYSGTFSFTTNTLNVTGLADFRSGGPITAGFGALAFSGSAAQTFIPKPAAVFPTIIQNGAGGTTVATNNLTAAGLSLINGTLNLGSGLTHGVTTVGGTGGGLDFGGSTLSAGGNVDLSGLSAVTAGTGRLEFSGSGTQTFSPRASATHPRIAQTGTGTTTLSGAGLTTSSLRLTAGALNLGAALSHQVADTLIATGGTLDFGSSTLKTAAASPDFSGLSTLVAGTGTLEFNGASTQAFTPKSLAIHPSVSQNGAGGTILLGSLTAGNLSITLGTLNLGSGFSHTFSGLTTTGGGLDFGGSLLATTGNADFSGLATLAAGSGTLSFTASSGTHVFIPKSGAVHPLIAHHAADTLRLSTNALSALGFAQTAGVLDLNGNDLTLAAGGNLDLFGGALPILGLGGRTLTVSGNARLAGTASAKLDLNPASAWTLAVGGLLSAANVRLANSVASSSGGVADSSLNLGGNTNWIFLDSIKPDNVSSLLASALGGTSAALSWTPSISEDADSVTIRYRTDGAYPANSTDGTLWRKVPAARSTDTATGLAEKTVYHFAAFVKDSSGNYSPSAAGAQDSARTPDVTPPANVDVLVASAATQTTVALVWKPSGTPDADTVMIRYLAGMVHPTNSADGLLWKKLPKAFANDTVTGLAANTVYAFSLFVRDSAGNYSPAAAGAQDTSLYQLPVSGTFAINDLSGLTADGDPSAAFTWSGADSLRFGQSADTAAAPWKAVRSLDSIALGADDGLKILAVQFKNIYGKRSTWYFDTTTLDRKAPVVTLDLKAAHSRWDWPVSVSGRSKDDLAGTDRVFVVRQRLSDGFHFNGATWVSTPDTAKLVLGASDSIFSAPLPAAAMTTGDYQFTAYARDLAGNVSAPVVTAVHFEENRMPALAFGNVPDTILQNQSGVWSLDFGDMDAADSLVTVSFDAPAWLSAAPGPDTAYAPWALHKVFTISGKPLQAHVGSNTVRVLMQDRAGLIFTYAKSILVADVNDAPVFADSQAVYSVDEDAVSRWTPGFKDEDVKDTHTMTLLAGPAFAKVEGLSVVFNTASRDVGDHSVRIEVSDGSLRDTLETLVTVVNVNDPPYAFPSKGWQSPAFWKEDHVDTFTVVVVDMDKNDPIILVTPMPVFAKVSSTVDSTGFNRTFRFVLTPGQGDTGSISLALTFQDAAGATSKLALLGRVVPFNDTPFAAIEDITTHAGAARIRLSVSDEDGSLEKARFHYRLIGASGDTLRRGITPSSQLALHPLADGAYTIAVMAEDQDGAKQPAYTVKPFSISGATRIVLDSARWHMLGAPHASLSASAFGAGATLASWDETGDDGQPLARYSSGKTVESLKRGKGYWVRLPMPITVNATLSDLLEGPFTLKLTHSKQGWNQVANPYPYFVDVTASRLTWWEWDAEKRDLVNARGLLKPWAAYWVLAPRDTTLVLSDAPYFPPVAGALAKAASASEGDFKHREDWSVQLALRAGGYHDQANLLGVRSMPGVPDMRSAVVGAVAPGLASEQGSPGLSLPDAPKFGDYVALHFEKTGVGADQGFANDFHSGLDPEEEWWDISVENAGTGENQAQLTPAGLEALAKNGLNLFLVRQGEATRIEPGGSVTLSLDAEKSYYSLVVTPHADFAARLKGNFSISQNFPNPVTTFTAFRFFLPQSWDKDGKRMAKDFKLRINLYDYSGRRVAQVASGSFRPGSHTLLWKPVSNGGGALSKGAYIYRLETASFVKSLKLVVE